MSSGGAADLGAVEDYERGSVVYFATDGLFVVRLESGAIAVLSDIDPHNPVGSDDCRVTFRPDLGEGSERGRFFDVCTGSLYDMQGRALSGDGRDLEALDFEQRDDGTLHLR